MEDLLPQAPRVSVRGGLSQEPALHSPRARSLIRGAFHRSGSCPELSGFRNVISAADQGESERRPITAAGSSLVMETDRLMHGEVVTGQATCRRPGGGSMGS